MCNFGLCSHYQISTPGRPGWDFLLTGTLQRVHQTWSQFGLCFLQPAWPGISKNSITGFRQGYWKQNWHNWAEIWGWFCILDAWISLGLFIFPWQYIIKTKKKKIPDIAWKLDCFFFCNWSLIFFLGNFVEIQTDGKEAPETILSSSYMYGWDDLLSNTLLTTFRF